MADPTIQTFCCHRTADNSGYYLMNEFNKQSFIIISMISSIIGISGSIYQIFIRKNYQEATTPRSLIGRKIIIYLAYSDMFASIGILVRTGIWSIVRPKMPYEDDSVSVLSCSITSAFIQLFYTATWLWTFVYAYNMRCALRNKTVQVRDLHIIVWTVSFLLTAIGTTSLYVPDANCHDIEDTATALLRIMPNYFVNYGPIAFVMIVNPIIYSQCSKEVDKQLIQRFGQYTNNERQIHDLFKIKFSLIIIIFYFCWFPNVINAILMWTMWPELSFRNTIGRIVVYNWYIIAVVNPLQAFFNAFIYRKWSEKLIGCCWIKDCFLRCWESGRGVNHTTHVISEATPLLQSTSTGLNNVGTEIEEIETREVDDRFYKFSIQCPLV
ncbi:G-protein coupled receptor 143-like [Chironomus tepperi]|uniref:G-protein coupled receptor 143-like n=1 Tax=Chironomus tepperi TaxID=113505 RepID=UPI00391EE882